VQLNAASQTGDVAGMCVCVCAVVCAWGDTHIHVHM